MTKPSVTCPVSKEKINESVARIVAFFTLVIVLIGIYYKSSALIGALALDFYLRAFTKGALSPLKYISKRLSNYLGVKEKMVDAAPKKFAAGLGLFFTLAIAGLLWWQYTKQADLLASILIICAALESFKGFCIGCIVYTYISLPFNSKKNSEQSTISINL